ncbi:hypothetical protein Slin15195_G050410 [Septoria linicola]|uniref:Uncharacterized protein n=1 Tax=Septoria linicola TaxID=215465 RepID=A0A9Q9EJ34_9PEZI|nr:hypothetical protein Slin14017_G053930 [Septoria linicola]USW51722.1 hypothetical protein Slin15195_G050410 [Septoria linicola]
MPTAEQQLEAASAAYKAYSKFEILPQSVPRFHMNAKGYPTIHDGERFCRFEDEFGMLCSAKMHNQHALASHVEGCHDIPSEHGPFSSVRKYQIALNSNELARGDRFFTELLKHEQYPGKLKHEHERINQAQIARPRPGAEVLDLEAALLEVQKKANVKQKEILELQGKENAAQKHLLELQSEEVKIKQKISSMDC